MNAMRYFEHPILGYIVLEGDSQNGLSELSFANQKPTQIQSEDSLLQQIETRLQAYLLGQKDSFFDIPLNLQGTPFQISVWNTLKRIPWGVTQSYKWVAEQLNIPKGSQAIGQANGRNPIPIIVPCHRVIQHNGSLGGYSGGLHIKSFLLSLEQVIAPQAQLDLGNTLAPSQTRAITLL